MGDSRGKWWMALVLVLAVAMPAALPASAGAPGSERGEAAGPTLETMVEAAVLRADASSLALPAMPGELVEELNQRPAGLAVRERVAEWVAEARAASPGLAGDDDAASGEQHLATLSLSRELVSVTPLGGLPENNSYDPALSGDGRVAAFVSAASDLVDGTVGWSNAFLRLRDARETVWVSEDPARAGPSRFEAAQPRVSADGRWVAYVGGRRFDGPGRVYVFDRVTGETVAVTEGLGSLLGGVSGDGRHVVFSSRDAGLVDEPLAAVENVYLYDRLLGEVRLLSRNAAGEPLDGPSYEPSISADGRWVAFVSWASNTLVGPPGGGAAVYLLDVATGQLRWVSRERGGSVVWLQDPAVSGDGRVVAFGDWPDVWVYDRDADALEYGFPGQHPRISADGRFVSATNGYSSVVRFDRATGRVVRLVGSNDGVLRSFYQGISADGSSVAYHERMPGPDGGFLGVVWVADLGENPPSLPAHRARGAVGRPSPHARRPVGAQSDPVNSLTGEFVTSVVDVEQSGAGVPFSLERTYGSLDERVGVLGRGWSLSLSARLELSGEAVVFVAEDGLPVPFRLHEDGVPVPEPGVLSRLERLDEGGRPLTPPEQTDRVFQDGGLLDRIGQRTGSDPRHGYRRATQQVPWAGTGEGGWRLMRPDQVAYTFDASGVLRRVEDRNGVGLTYAYDTDGLLTSVTDDAGRTAALRYDRGLLVEVALADGRTVGYGYHGELLTSVRDVRGGVTRYAYDDAGRLTVVTDQVGDDVVTNAYGDSGRALAQTDALGATSTFDWDPLRQTSTMTDAHGAEWRDVYYGGVLVMRVDPLGAETVYDYDQAFNLVRVTDPVGAVTELGYDPAGNVTSVTDALGAVTRFAYDGLNNVVSVADPLGHETQFVYDDAGNLVASVDPTGAASRLEVDARGLVVAVTDPLGATTRLEHDEAGRLAAVTSPSGHRSTLAYDAAGWVVETIDARGYEPGADPEAFAWRFERDAAGNLLAETDPLGASTVSVYDPAGRLVQRTDPLGRVTGWHHDAMGRLVAVVAPDGTETTYAYDAAGRVVSRTDALGRTTGYGYDPAGRLVEVVDPLGHRWTYAYDAAGRQVRVVDANAHAAGEESAGTAAFSYDAAGRLAAVAYGDATADVAFGYDPAGRRVEMRDGAGTVTYAYDPRGLLTAVARAGQSGFGYRYDSAGRLVERRYPDGTLVGEAWDPDGRLVAVTDGTEASATFAYDAAGHAVGAVHGSGVRETREVDAAGRVASVQVRDPAGGLIASHAYVRDAGGNPLVDRRLDERVAYRYDVLDQLIEACYLPADAPDECGGGAGQRYRYAYDPVGNRLEADTPEGLRRFTYDAADRLSSIEGEAGTVEVTHDANGNRLDDGTRRYRWDSAGRLVEVQVPGEQRTVAYRYDGDGMRLSATVTGPDGDEESRRDWTWDVNHPLPELAVETSAEGEPLRRYLHGLDGPLTVTGPDVTGGLHRDALGSVTALTGPEGTLAETFGYEPFGAPLSERAGGLPLGFTGEHHDPVTALVHLRARDYDPATGRFLSPDPWPGLAEDPYVAARVYAGNRPTVFTDPAGLFCMIGRNPNGTCRGAAPTRDILQTVHLTADYVAIGAGAATLVCIAVCQSAIPVLSVVSGTAGAVSTAAGTILAFDHCFQVRLTSSCYWALAGAAIGSAPGAFGSMAQRSIWNAGGSRVPRRQLMDVVGGEASIIGGTLSRQFHAESGPAPYTRSSPPKLRSPHLMSPK